MGEDDFTKIPNGAPGIETRMSLMYDGGVHKGRLSLNRWIQVCCTAPARIFGMFPQKGTIAPGSAEVMSPAEPSVASTPPAVGPHRCTR